VKMSTSLCLQKACPKTRHRSRFANNRKYHSRQRIRFKPLPAKNGILLFRGFPSAGLLVPEQS
jgi:hypothetical protein